MKMRLIILSLGLILGIFSCYSQTYDELIASSFDYLEKNDLLGAEESLKAAMRKEPANPRNVLLLSNLGTIQQREGKLEEALLSYNSALSRSPSNVVLLANRANLYVEMGEADKAIFDYSALLVKDEKNENALYERGLLYLSKKDYVSAETDFEKLLDINPNTLNGRKGIATLCKLQGKYAEAEKIYIFLIDRVPDQPDLYLSRAELYLLMDKNGKASSDINKAISLETEAGIKDPYAYILRAQLKIRQYEKKAALKDIEQAIQWGYDRQKARELMELCK